MDALGGEGAASGDMLARGDQLSRDLADARTEQRKAEGALEAARDFNRDEAAWLQRANTTHRVEFREPGQPGGQQYALTGGQPAPAPGDPDLIVYREGPNAGRPATVARGQSIASHPVVEQMAAANAVRDQAVISTYGGVGQMVRALATTGTGSALVPTVWSAQIIDRARQLAAVMQAGAETVPMDARTVIIGRLTGDPQATWRAEGSPITASDPALDSVTLVAKTLSALVVTSMEYLQDVTGVDALLTESISKQMALAIDYAALFGGVTAGSEGVNQPSPPSPVGILANLLANAPSSVLGGATNGTAITPATPWNEVLDTLLTPTDYNEVPNAILWNSKMARKLAKSYDSLGQPLRQPDALANVDQYVTNQIPSFSAGTMSNIATDVFAGDFRQVIIGQRLDIQLEMLTERYAEMGQVAFVAHFRGDVQLARPRAMCVYRYLGGS